MNNFDIRFDTIYADEKSTRKNAFSFTIVQKDHDIAMGYYVIYPNCMNSELILVPKFKFDEDMAYFEELSDKVAAIEKEKNDGGKSRFKKVSVPTVLTKQEVEDLKFLRSIISHACVFSVTGAETTVVLPYKYIDMLKIDTNILTFVETKPNEFIIVNPKNAWKYSAPENYNYADNPSPKALFNRLKKAI
ncbi:MAG: hypothetical protein NC320_04195 [Clostridium sp.]|nr:hypothetical protein [Clostridium sp.]MCM1547146.1 hypothetical protein [Ruminococcus sp.]